jgi:hypothetical protein
MARKVMPRGPQTITELELVNTTGAPQANSYVRVDRSLGLVNQRLYRQHMTYYAEATLQTDQTQGLVEVYALATNWWCLGALRTAKKMHDRAMKDERNASGQSRWYDFRISGAPGGADELIPAGLIGDGAGGTVAVDTTGSEYEFSRIEDADGNGKAFSLFAASGATAYNVFTEWDRMGNIDVDPTSAPLGGYDAIVSDVQSENQVDLLEKGNNPPYNRLVMNLRWVKVGELYQTAGGAQSLSTGLFAAPLGLVYLKGFAATTSNVRLIVPPGDYKGVMASAI